MQTRCIAQFSSSKDLNILSTHLLSQLCFVPSKKLCKEKVEHQTHQKIEFSITVNAWYCEFFVMVKYEQQLNKVHYKISVTDFPDESSPSSSSIWLVLNRRWQRCWLLESKKTRRKQFHGTSTWLSSFFLIWFHCLDVSSSFITFSSSTVNLTWPMC